MDNYKSFFACSLILCCGILASIIAFFHYLLIQLGISSISYHIQNAPLGVYKSLLYRYRVCVMRAVITLFLKSPIRKLTLKLVDFNIPNQAGSGCIIVICHTQWENILVQSCLDNDFGLIIGRRKWKSKKKKIQILGKGYSNMRKIIRHLQQNGRIIIAADSFNEFNNCPIKFRGQMLNASILPSRLAKAASVPLIVAFPILSKATITFIIGPQYTVEMLKKDTINITQQIIFFLDLKLKNDYRIWSSLGR